VCAWSLGRLELAESAFLETARYPAMAALAYYNLGLVHQRRGDDGAAQSWFERALAGSGNDDALRQLAEAQLRGTTSAAAPAAAAAGPGTTAARRPTVFISEAVGYDDNVALVADGELLGVTDLSSPYGELQALADVPLARDLSFQGGAYLVNYTDLSELNQDGLQLDLRFTPRAGAWRAELGGGYGLNRIDGERFADERSLLLGAVRPLGGGWDLRLRLRYADVEGSAPYQGLSGDRGEAALRLRRIMDTQRWRLEYRFEDNDREDAALSPERHRIELEWRHALGRGIEGMLAAGWQRSRYDTSALSWSERRKALGAGLTGPITRHWDWVARYDWTDNSASVPEYEYNRNRVFIGAQAVF
jgi:hypothetical protein